MACRRKKLTDTLRCTAPRRSHRAISLGKEMLIFSARDGTDLGFMFARVARSGKK